MLQRHQQIRRCSSSRPGAPWWLCLCVAAGCGGASAASAPDPNSGYIGSSSAPFEFSFTGGEELVVSSATTRGRVTALLFVTTFDMASQLMLRRLEGVVVKFTPRANAAAVVLEAPRYAELLPAYRESLGLPFPVVMADFGTLQGQGPFATIEHVPTLVVLDRAGREVARRQGSLSAAEIEAELSRANHVGP